MAASDFPGELRWGPAKLRGWLNKLRAAAIKTHIATVSGGGTLNSTPSGTGLNTASNIGDETFYVVKNGALYTKDFAGKPSVRVT